MKTRILAWGLTVLSAGCFASMARADTWKIVPSVALQQKYSDNIFFDAENAERDFITTVSPALEFSEKTERLAASFKAQLDSLFYYDNTDLNATDHNYRGNIRYAVSPKMNVFAGAGYRQDSQVDRDIGDTGLLQGTSTRKQYSYQAGGDYALSEMMSVQLAYEGVDDDYEDPADSDFQSQAFSCVLSRDLSAVMRSTVGRLTGVYTVYEQTSEQTVTFPGFYSLANENMWKVRNYSGSVGAEHQWDERFTVFADIGWRYTESTLDTLRVLRFENPPSSSATPYQQESSGNGFTGRFGGAYRGEVSSANLTVSQEVGGASGTTGATDRTILRGAVGRQLNERSRLDLVAEYYVNTSVQSHAYGAEIDEKTLRLNPRMWFELTREFGVEAAYLFEQVDDQENDSVSRRNIVWCRLVYQYPLFE